MIGNAEIVLTRGPGAGRTFALDRDALVLGRDPRSDVVIDHPQVSRRHARITRRDRVWVIEDLNSTNGTLINGTDLSGSKALTAGDVIGLGEAVTLIYRETPAPSERRAPRPADQAAPSQPHRARVPPERTFPIGPAPQRVERPGPAPAAHDPGPGQDPYRTWLWVAIGCAVVLVVLACAAVFLLYALRLLPAFVP